MSLGFQIYDLAIVSKEEEEGIGFESYKLSIPYELEKALRCFYNQFKPCMSLGFQICDSSHRVYFLQLSQCQLYSFIICIDDLLIVNENANMKVIVTKIFEIKDLRVSNQILRMRIFKDKKKRKIWIKQKSYIYRF